MKDKKDKPKLKIVSSNKTPNKNKLTAKQLGFCKDVVYGNMTLINAYRNNYNVSDDIKGNTLRMLASRLRAKDNIGITINKMLEEKETLNKMTEVKKEELILNKLTEFMNNEDFSDSARVRSAELIGKHYKLFTDVTEVTNKDKSTTEIEYELKEKLSKLLKG